MELLTANIAAVLLMNVYFFYLLSHLIRSRRLEEELVLYQRENELRYHYYEELTGNTGESWKVIHDMKIICRPWRISTPARKPRPETAM